MSKRTQTYKTWERNFRSRGKKWGGHGPPGPPGSDAYACITWLSDPNTVTPYKENCDA